MYEYSYFQEFLNNYTPATRLQFEYSGRLIDPIGKTLVPMSHYTILEYIGRQRAPTESSPIRFPVTYLIRLYRDCSSCKNDYSY